MPKLSLKKAGAHIKARPFEDLEDGEEIFHLPCTEEICDTYEDYLARLSFIGNPFGCVHIQRGLILPMRRHS